MAEHRFGRIDRYVLLGGGQLLFDLACDLKPHALVVTSRRHALHEVQFGPGTTPLHKGLEAQGIATWVVEDVETDERTLKAITPSTLGISLAAEWIFRQPFIDRFEGRLVNLHGTRLPDGRGGGGYSWTILMGERDGGSTIHLLEAGVDTGAIVAASEYRFPHGLRTPADYQAVALREKARLLRRFVADVRAGKSFELRQQNEALGVCWPRLDTERQGFIDWSWSADEIERFIRAFDDPHAGASTFWNDRRVYLKQCRLTQADGLFHPFQSGIVYRKWEGAIYVAATTGSLVVRSVRDSDGPCEIRLGDRLHTPRATLDAALEHRAVIRPHGLGR